MTYTVHAEIFFKLNGPAFRLSPPIGGLLVLLAFVLRLSSMAELCAKFGRKPNGKFQRKCFF